MAKKKQKETKKVSVQTYGAEAQGAQINLPKSNPTPISEPKKKTTKTKKTTDNHQRNPKDAEVIKRNVRKNEIQIKYKNVYDLGQKVKNGTATDLEKAEFGARQRTFLGNISDATTMIGFQSLYDRYEKFAVGQDYDINKASAGIEIAKILEKDMQKRMEYAALFDEKNFENVDSLYGTIKSAKEHLTNAKSNMEKYGDENEYRIFRTYSNFSDIKDLEDTRYNLVKQKEEMQRVGGFEREIADIDKRLGYIDENGYSPEVISSMGTDDLAKLEEIIKNFEKQQYNPEISFDERKRYKNLYYSLSDEIRLRKSEIATSEKWDKIVSDSDDSNPKYKEGTSGDGVYDTINYGKSPDDFKTANLPSALRHKEVEDWLWLKTMTTQEKEIYNRIYNKYGKVKADEYIKDITPFLNKRREIQRAKSQYEFDSEHPVYATLRSLATSPGRTIHGLGVNAANIYDTISGNEIDPYSKRFTPTRVNNTGMEAVKYQIDSEIGKIAYTIGVEVADLALNMSLANGVGKVAGAVSNSANALQTASKVSNVANQILLSSNSMLDTTLKYKESGESDLAAVGMGLLSGIIEAWTERNSLSRLMKSPDIYKELTKKEFAKVFTKKLGVDFVQEGWEEVEANILNSFAQLMLGYVNDTTFMTVFDKAIADGESESDAFNKALWAVGKENLEAFVVGGFAGLGFGGVNAISGRSTYTRARDSAEAYFGENGYSEESLFGLMTTQADSLPDALAMAETVQKATRGELSGKEAEALSYNPVLSGVFTAYKKGYTPRANIETETLPDESVNVPEYKSESENSNVPKMSKEDAQQIISGTDKQSALGSKGREGTRVISNAYDTTSPTSFISKLIKEGYSEEKATNLIDGIYSFMYARGREGADLQETLGAVRAEIFDGVAKYENDLKAFYMAGARDSANWMMGKTNARVVQNDVVKRLLKERKIDHKTIRAMNAIARKLGIDIIFADDVDGDGEFNTKTGVLRINANAKNRFFVTSVHESIHALRTIDPESYNKITDMVYEVLGKNEETFSKAWSKVLSAYKKDATDENGNLNKDYINEELNAKVISELLTNEEFINELAKQDRNLFQKIRDLLVDLFDKIFVRYSEESNASYEINEALKALKNEFNTIKTMYQTALESTESVQGETIESNTEDLSFKMDNVQEDTKDLIAVHNLNANQLSDAIERQAFFMPSTAVTNQAHTDFGDISVVFYRDTIDPKLDKSNKLYGSDAWTPTQTRLKKDAVFNDAKVNDFIAEIQKTIGQEYGQIFNVDSKRFKNDVTKSDGSLYDAFADNLGMQTAYAIKNKLISKVPMLSNGRIDESALRERLDSKLDNDAQWRKYKRWLGEVSDSIISSYGIASNEDIMNNMRSQPDSAKRFRLAESGELTVPATEYESIDQYKQNKNRLSQNADAETMKVGNNFINWAKHISAKSDVPLRNVIQCINSTFDNRYSTLDIARQFLESGISITSSQAGHLQQLYKQSVELPTKYFEAKPQRTVGFDEVAAVVLPNNVPSDIKAKLSNMGVKFVEYEKGNDAQRIAALNSLEGVRFSRNFGLQNGVYNKKQSVEKNGDVFYNKDYWHTDLNKTEFKMLEGWINKAGFPEHTKITDTANWYEGRLNGEPIFAVYSSIYANNPTILYEVRGKNAVIEKDILLDLLEEQDYGTNINGQSSFTQGISQRNWMQNVNGSQNHRRNMGKRTDSRNAGVLPQQPKGNGSRAFWNVIQNIFEIQEETRNGINSNDVLKSKPDITPDETITPPKIRTTAQLKQSAFELDERIRKKLKQQADKYGEMEKGEMPSRNVTIPKETDAGKVRAFQRTAIEADSVSDEAAREIAESIANEELSSVYSVVSNKKVYEESKRLLEVRGFDSMLNEWEALLESGRKIEKQDISNAMLLVTEAEKKGDTETEVRILTQLAAEATAAGQSVQAFSLLKRLGPNAQTYAMNRAIERIKRNIDKKYGKQIEVPEELLTQYEEALKKEREAGNGNTVESDKYADQIMRHIGEQIPANWLDKWNAWRMLSMLGNAKTHIRNFGSNLVMWPVRFFKDMNAMVLERVFLDNSKRTKTLKGQFTRGDILKFAKEDAKKIESVLRGESKYGDLGGFGNMQDYRRIFKTDWLEGLSKKNSELLEKEDWWGLKLNYARAFTNYVVSQNLDVNNLTEEQLASARKIAVKEAQKATFRDANAVATWLNSAHDKSEVLGFAVDAVMPFKKTPMNVLKRGVEYSPVGLIKSLSWGIYQVRSGKINANEFIDGIASGVTGTGLMLIGMLLKSAGLLRGAGDEDEYEGKLNKIIGAQNYSFVIGDHSYTIDWLSPSAMPLFVGCELMGLLNEENISLGEFMKSFSRVLEPAFEMSMLQSLNDLISVASYEETASAALGRIAMDIPLSYLGQGVPTALGQISRTIDNTKRKTYINKDSVIPDFLQSFAQQQMKKIPFLTFALEPYVNEKGQTEKNAQGNIFSRILQNFVSPGYYKKVKSTAVDEEISRLYKTVDGASGIIPKTAKKTIKVNGKDYHLSAEQHNTYQEEMGKTYYEKAKEIITSDYYKGLSDSEKVKLLEKAMEYAGDKGKHKAVPEYKFDNGWLKTAMETPGGYKYLIETNKSAKFSEKDLESDAFDTYESQRDSMFRDILSNSELPTEDDVFMDKYYANLYQFTEDVALEANSDGQFTVDTKWINEIKGLSTEQQAEYIYGKTLRAMYDTDAEANTAINNDPNISSAIKLKLLNDVTVIPKSPEKSYKEHNLTKFNVSSDLWLDVYNEYNKIKETKQPNGKTLSKKDQIIMYINSKKISDKQKSALYRALGYKDTGKNLKVPWSYQFDLTNPTDYADALGFKVAYTNTANYNNDAARGQCVWYARGRAKEKLSANIPALGDANQMYASAKPEARLEITKNNIKPNTLVTYKVGTSPAGQKAGHVIYIEDVVGDTVYYTEGGGSSNGVVKKSTKDNIMKGLSGNNSTIGTYINGIIDVTKY